MNDFQEPKILFNRARCRKCGTFLESKHVHDIQTCACGAVSIDGGQEYIRQTTKNLDDIEDLTEYEGLCDETIYVPQEGDI